MADSTDDVATLSDRALRAFRADTHLRERVSGGVLNIDRRLPLLFAYRRPPDRSDPGTDRLILGESAYLIADADAAGIHDTVRTLAEASTAEFGSFLLLELWAGDDASRTFVIHAPDRPGSIVSDALRDGLQPIAADLDATVEVRITDERHPPDLEPLLDAATCWRIGCLAVGLEVPPVFREGDDLYPVFLRRLRSRLSGVLRRAAHEFARVQTSAAYESHRALGPRRADNSVLHADRELADIERSYPLLLLVAPLNSNEAWTSFKESGFEREPDFRYRLLPVDPDTLKRRLYDVDLEPVADPALAFLMHDKRTELDRQITLIDERGTPGFRYASIRLYGAVDDLLLRVAHELLDTVKIPPRGTTDDGERVSATDFAVLARAEIDAYRAALPDLPADIQVRPDISGLMVSNGNLLIGERLRLRERRVQPLLHHEVGTHVLTYHNGRQQPLRQLASGLADYDEFQEGIAVFTEYLAGGLDAARMRVLAARVVAAHSVEQGASFVETFRLLHRDHGFTAGSAFDITERVHQCGGFTRDLIYLRGLLRLVEYIRGGGDLEPLFIGKIAAKHIEIVDELRTRGFLRPAPLTPRLFESPATADRIRAVRDGLTLTGMIAGTP